MNTEIGGRYRLVRRLGVGGTGSVYQAADLVLGRTVAVKALDSSLASAILRHEGRSLARLTHPNVVSLHDLVESDGQTYLIMEFVDGCDLDHWLRDHGPLPLDAALALFRQVAAAIARAHALGLLHCDLKPANILLSTAGEVKLADFTLARLSSDGTRGWSPAYAAPEQISGNALDERTDVYGLGALLAALTGRLDKSSPETAQVAAVIARATASEPDDRFPSVEAMMAALPKLDAAVTRVTASSSLSTLTRVRPDTAPTPAIRRRVRWTLAAIPAALLLAGAGLFSHFTASASPTRVTVPDFAGAQLGSADLILRSFALHPRTVERYSSAAPAGVIIAQQPSPGSELAKLATVTLIVSKGPAPVVVPNVSGLSRSDAITRLRRLGFRVTVSTDDSVLHDFGDAVSQSPAANVSELPGSTITITVSTKPWWWIF